VKIIVGSGYGHHPLADDPARFGAQTFVPKPYSLQTIQDHLQLCQRKG
jgi:FixJ family two-component response regulator